MRDLHDIIEFEDESLTVDFKSTQYHIGNNESLIKDIVSMANAKTKDDRFIILGVKHKPNGDKEFIDLEKNIVDDASYQQLIHENVEPELNFSYSPFKYKGYTLGVIIISSPNNPPYMLKKDFGKLKKGDSFIRKGSHQTRLSRGDIDYYFDQKVANISFSDKIDIKFKSTNDKILVLYYPNEFILPSMVAKEELEKLIEEKERKLLNPLSYENLRFDDGKFAAFNLTPFGLKSIEDYKKDLLSIDTDYEEEDFFYMFEEKAEKINLILSNRSTVYLEDASIELRIPKLDFILVAEEIYNKPNYENNHYLRTVMPEPISWEEMNYPVIEVNDDCYLVKEELGDLKHNIPNTAFKVPFRLTITPTIEEHEIPMEVRIFAKNLHEPYMDNLIVIIKKSEVKS